MGVLNLIEICIIIVISLSSLGLMEFDFGDNLQPVEFVHTLDTIEDGLDGILDIAESYGVDEGNGEGYILAAILGVGGTISGYFSMLPFIDDEEGSDIALTLGDTLCSGILISLLFFPSFAYSTICSSITWQVPSIFYLFLPGLEILGKLLRSFNTALRICSNSTAGHLLVLLLSASLEIARNHSTIVMAVLSLITGFVIILEIAVSALQGYIFTALLLYYTHIDE